MSKKLFGIVWLAVWGANIFNLMREKAVTDPAFITVAVFLVFLTICAIRQSTRVFALIVTVTFALPFYAFELYLNLMLPSPFSKAATALSLRDQGLRSYPAVFPSGLIIHFSRDSAASSIVVDGAPIMPLSGIPNRATVYCRGQDGIIVYLSDWLGFRNTPNAHEFKRLEIAILGDSFVQGFCVPDIQTYAEQFAALGHSISFGMNSTSTLLQYAIYKEFVYGLQPKRVIWFFYEGNDLVDFRREFDFKPIRAYLNPDHSQGLVALNDKVASALERYIDERLSEQDVTAIIHDQRKLPFWPRVRAFFTLQLSQYHIMNAFFSKDKESTTGPKEARERIRIWNTYYQTFETIWRRVIASQREHGGSVTFVYIPDHRRFQEFADKSAYIELERRVRKLWSKLDADHVTLTDFLLSTGDPLSFYDGRLHFNKEGYKRTANYIIEHIKKLSVKKPN